MQFLLRLGLLMLVGLGLLACGATIKPPAEVVLNVTAADSGLRVVEALSDAFTAREPNVFLEVDQANSNRALQRLLAGQTNLVLSTVPPPEPTQLRITPVARDGLWLVVHPGNPVTNLTLAELQGLYNGRIFSWQDVQGQDLPVEPVLRERDSGLRQLFEARVMQGVSLTPRARVFPGGEAAVAFVAQTPGAIAFVGRAQVTDAVKVLAVEDITPTTETIRRGAYPLTHPLLLVTPPQPEADVRSFLDFALSPAGQSLVEESGLGRIR